MLKRPDVTTPHMSRRPVRSSSLARRGKARAYFDQSSTTCRDVAGLARLVHRLQPTKRAVVYFPLPLYAPLLFLLLLHLGGLTTLTQIFFPVSDDDDRPGSTSSTTASGIFNLPLAHAALSVPSGYESLMFDIRDRVLVSERDLEKPKADRVCSSTEGPYCLPNTQHFLGDTVLSRRLFGPEAVADALKTLNEYLQKHSDELFQKYRQKMKKAAASSAALPNGNAGSSATKSGAAKDQGALASGSGSSSSRNQVTKLSSEGSGISNANKGKDLSQAEAPATSQVELDSSGGGRFDDMMKTIFPEGLEATNVTVEDLDAAMQLMQLMEGAFPESDWPAMREQLEGVKEKLRLREQAKQASSATSKTTTGTTASDHSGDQTAGASNDQGTNNASGSSASSSTESKRERVKTEDVVDGDEEGLFGNKTAEEEIDAPNGNNRPTQSSSSTQEGDNANAAGAADEQGREEPTEQGHTATQTPNAGAGSDSGRADTSEYDSGTGSGSGAHQETEPPTGSSSPQDQGTSAPGGVPPPGEQEAGSGGGSGAPTSGGSSPATTASEQEDQPPPAGTTGTPPGENSPTEASTTATATTPPAAESNGAVVATTTSSNIEESWRTSEDMQLLREQAYLLTDNQKRKHNDYEHRRTNETLTDWRSEKRAELFKYEHEGHYDNNHFQQQEKRAVFTDEFTHTNPTAFMRFTAQKFPGNAFDAQLKKSSDMYSRMKTRNTFGSSLWKRATHEHPLLEEGHMPVLNNMLTMLSEASRKSSGKILGGGDTGFDSAENVNVRLLEEPEDRADVRLLARYLWPQYRSLNNIFERAGYNYLSSDREDVKPTQQSRESVFAIESKYSRKEDFPPTSNQVQHPFCYDNSCLERDLVGIPENEVFLDEIQGKLYETEYRYSRPEFRAKQLTPTTKFFGAQKYYIRFGPRNHFRKGLRHKHLQRHWQYSGITASAAAPRVEDQQSSVVDTAGGGDAAAARDINVQDETQTASSPAASTTSSPSTSTSVKPKHLDPQLSTFYLANLQEDLSTQMLYHRGYVHGMTFEEKLSRFSVDRTFLRWKPKEPTEHSMLDRDNAEQWQGKEYSKELPNQNAVLSLFSTKTATVTETVRLPTKPAVDQLRDSKKLERRLLDEFSQVLLRKRADIVEMQKKVQAFGPTDLLENAGAGMLQRLQTLERDLADQEQKYAAFALGYVAEAGPTASFSQPTSLDSLIALKQLQQSSSSSTSSAGGSSSTTTATSASSSYSPTALSSNITIVNRLREASYYENIAAFPTLRALVEKSKTAESTKFVAEAEKMGGSIQPKNGDGAPERLVVDDQVFVSNKAERIAELRRAETGFLLGRGVIGAALNRRHSATVENIKSSDSCFTQHTTSPDKSLSPLAASVTSSSKRTSPSRSSVHHYPYSMQPKRNQKKRLKVKFQPEKTWVLAAHGFVPKSEQSWITLEQPAVVRELKVFFDNKKPLNFGKLEISGMKQGVEIWRRHVLQPSDQADSACPVGSRVFYQKESQKKVRQGRVVRHFPMLGMMQIEPFKGGKNGKVLGSRFSASAARSSRGQYPYRFPVLFRKQSEVANDKGINCAKYAVTRHFTKKLQDEGMASTGAGFVRRDLHLGGEREAETTLTPPTSVDETTSNSSRSSAAAAGTQASKSQQIRPTSGGSSEDLVFKKKSPMSRRRRVVKITDGALETVDTIFFRWQLRKPSLAADQVEDQDSDSASSRSSGANAPSTTSSSSSQDPFWGVDSFTLAYVQDPIALWDAHNLREMWYQEQMRRAEEIIWTNVRDAFEFPNSPRDRNPQDEAAAGGNTSFEPSESFAQETTSSLLEVSTRQRTHEIVRTGNVTNGHTYDTSAVKSWSGTGSYNDWWAKNAMFREEEEAGYRIVSMNVTAWDFTAEWKARSDYRKEKAALEAKYESELSAWKNRTGTATSEGGAAAEAAAGVPDPVASATSPPAEDGPPQHVETEPVKPTLPVLTDQDLNRAAHSTGGNVYTKRRFWSKHAEWTTYGHARPGGWFYHNDLKYQYDAFLRTVFPVVTAGSGEKQTIYRIKSTDMEYNSNVDALTEQEIENPKWLQVIKEKLLSLPFHAWKLQTDQFDLHKLLPGFPQGFPPAEYAAVQEKRELARFFIWQQYGLWLRRQSAYCERSGTVYWSKLKRPCFNEGLFEHSSYDVSDILKTSSVWIPEQFLQTPTMTGSGMTNTGSSSFAVAKKNVYDTYSGGDKRFYNRVGTEKDGAVKLVHDSKRDGFYGEGHNPERLSKLIESKKLFKERKYDDVPAVAFDTSHLRTAADCIRLKADYEAGRDVTGRQRRGLLEESGTRSEVEVQRPIPFTNNNVVVEDFYPTEVSRTREITRQEDKNSHRFRSWQAIGNLQLHHRMYCGSNDAIFFDEAGGVGRHVSLKKYRNAWDFYLSRNRDDQSNSFEDTEPKRVKLDPYYSVVQVLRQGDTKINEISGAAVMWSSNELLTSDLQVIKRSELEKARVREYKRKYEGKRNSDENKDEAKDLLGLISSMVGSLFGSGDSSKEEASSSADSAASLAKGPAGFLIAPTAVYTSNRLLQILEDILQYPDYFLSGIALPRDVESLQLTDTTGIRDRAGGSYFAADNLKNAFPSSRNSHSKSRKKSRRNSRKTASKSTSSAIVGAAKLQWNMVSVDGETGELWQNGTRRVSKLDGGPSLLVELEEEQNHLQHKEAAPASSTIPGAEVDATTSGASVASTVVAAGGEEQGEAGVVHDEARSSDSRQGVNKTPTTVASTENDAQVEESSQVIVPKKFSRAGSKSHSGEPTSPKNSLLETNSLNDFLIQTAYLLGFLGEAASYDDQGQHLSDYKNFERFFQTVLEQRSIALSEVLRAMREYKVFGYYSRELLAEHRKRQKMMLEQDRGKQDSTSKWDLHHTRVVEGSRTSISTPRRTTTASSSSSAEGGEEDGASGSGSDYSSTTGDESTGSAGSGSSSGVEGSSNSRHSDSVDTDLGADLQAAAPPVAREQEENEAAGDESRNPTRSGPVLSVLTPEDLEKCKQESSNRPDGKCTMTGEDSRTTPTSPQLAENGNKAPSGSGRAAVVLEEEHHSQNPSHSTYEGAEEDERIKVIVKLLEEKADHLGPAEWVKTGQHFQGAYFCAQGETRMKVRFEKVTPKTGVASIYTEDQDAPLTELEITALLSFETGTGIKGSFTLTGTVFLDTGIIHLDGKEWIEQPEGYSMVGIVGTFSRKHIAGRDTFINYIAATVTADFCDYARATDEFIPLELAEKITPDNADEELDDTRRIVRAMHWELTRLRRRWGSKLSTMFSDMRAAKQEKSSAKVLFMDSDGGSSKGGSADAASNLFSLVSDLLR
ncbi:unnamed protein product [Amoebophrya sp. A120]|nr:unnamed protein product [Amoebophrya sp. A120]|eukprot:GSA120T00025672001.1